MPHYELCAKVISVTSNMLCMKSGGYFESEFLGYAFSINSVFGAMTYDEKEATLPGLAPGKELPQSFLLPHCSMDSLWTFGLH